MLLRLASTTWLRLMLNIIFMFFHLNVFSRLTLLAHKTLKEPRAESNYKSLLHKTIFDSFLFVRQVAIGRRVINYERIARDAVFCWMRSVFFDSLWTDLSWQPAFQSMDDCSNRLKRDEVIERDENRFGKSSETAFSGWPHSTTAMMRKVKALWSTLNFFRIPLRDFSF